VPIKGTAEKEKKPAATKFSKTNTVKKFVVDQVIGGPVNTVLFLAAMGYLLQRPEWRGFVGVYQGG
jgi:hypothetical protein